MSYREPDVLARMASVWETEIDGQPRRNPSLTSAAVRLEVEKTFTESSLRSALVEFLEHMCTVFENDEVPSRRERYLNECALAMTTEKGGVPVVKPLVQRIVRTFPPAGLYFPVGLLIAEYLTFGELVDSLLAGIAAPSHPKMIEDCLTGFRLYLGKARSQGPEKTNRHIHAAMERLAPLARSNDAETRRLAENALTALRNHLA